ncbi:polysaccharide biosynthesis/export family protein [Desulfoprunum benzoelyticum]|uniref:Polysaccharide export outer membrane protein n=1 Tax=Desulfoprunum benzoelyticum TaxID=1506996 RepID=A0A840UQQ5_9BACT|nr:polysaccharide biosynthesis/export family protein [Desulfoprunum benzoelyticum]MBB5346963.1 polysaccharide export outer membrane protein [Desulfoprunum benzoelyticum]MBM9531019.1 polysaccharide biosynthesis/export family protein [Desulfoprunum benzoelyticum]
MKKMAAVLFLMFLSAVVMPTMVFAAQSTADVPATEELKAKARADILAGAKEGAAGTDYLIGAGDILGISVYGEGDMAVAPVQGTAGEEEGEGAKETGSGVPVRIDGKISLRHVGDVEAAGLTLTQLADYLKIVYATVFDDPVLTTVLVQSNSQRYTVMGKVATPGVFQITYPVNIVQAVARSGGFTEWANSKITLVRKDGPKDKLFEGNTFKFDYNGFMKGKNLERNIQVLPGDTLIVH